MLHFDFDFDFESQDGMKWKALLAWLKDSSRFQLVYLFKIKPYPASDRDTVYQYFASFLSHLVVHIWISVIKADSSILHKVNIFEFLFFRAVYKMSFSYK